MDGLATPGRRPFTPRRMSHAPPDPEFDRILSARPVEGFPPVRKRELFGWYCYDFANSAFTTIIITVVYAVYFVTVIAEEHPRAEGWWGTALSGSLLVVIFLSPLIGAFADVTARKKRLLMITAVICSAATCALTVVGPGQIALALGLVILANIAYSFGENICAAFLPEISTPANVGRISGYGWSFGYVGGLISLVLVLLIINSGEGRVPWTLLMTGLFFMLSCLPTFLLLQERAHPQVLAPGETYLHRGWRQLLQMRQDLPQHRTLAIFFIGLTFYISGLMAVVAFASLFATNVIGMTQSEVIGLFILLQIAGVAGAFSFGFLQDRVSAKLALMLALILWVGVCVGGAVCETKGQFYAIGALAGVAMGSLQSAGRAVVSTLTPPGRSGEFFGYWGFFGKLAGVIGPLTFGWIVTFTDYRTAIAVNAGFFLIGLLILLPLSIRPASR